MDFDVHLFAFSDIISEGLSSTNNGLKTNYSNLFNEIKSRFFNRNVAALILASDGIYNSGSDPLYNRSINYPVYPIVLGDTCVKEDVKIVKEMVL